MSFGTNKYEALSLSVSLWEVQRCQRFSGTLSIQLNKVNVTYWIGFCRFHVVRRCQETSKFMGKHMNDTKLMHQYRNIRNIANHNSISKCETLSNFLYASYNDSIIRFLFLVHPFHEVKRSMAGDELGWCSKNISPTVCRIKNVVFGLQIVHCLLNT